MCVSHAERSAVECGGCGESYRLEVWVIVHAEERPDLMNRARAGALHDLICPRCRRTADVRSAILICRPGHTPACSGRG